MHGEETFDAAPMLCALFESLRAQTEQLRQREVAQLHALKPWLQAREHAYAGPTFEVQRAWLQGTQAGIAQVGALAELRLAYLGVLVTAFERAAESFKDDTQPALKSVREIFDAWVKIADRAWWECIQSDTHARQFATLATSTLKARQAVREIARASARAFGFSPPWPTVQAGNPLPPVIHREEAIQEVVMNSVISPQKKPTKRKATASHRPTKSVTKKKTTLKNTPRSTARAKPSEFDIGHIGRITGNAR